jgi:N-acetylneuraminic acid mutarotase
MAKDLGLADSKAKNIVKNPAIKRVLHVCILLCLAWGFDIQAQADSANRWQLMVSENQATKRYENGYVAVGDTFYLVGGRYTRPVDVFDPMQNRWTTIPNSTPPFQMHHFQAVELNGLVYVVGAFTGWYPGETGITHVYTYNPATNVWTKGTEIPAARRRGSAGAVAYNGKIYVVCGIVGGHSWGCTKWFDEFDPATGIWTVLPDAPRVRDHFSAVVVGDKLYAAGGRVTEGTPDEFFSKTPREVDVYDFVTGQWSTLDANLPTGRAAPSAAVLDNKIFVMGGESPQWLAHNETEAYDLETNTWLTMAPMATGRHGTQAIVWNDRIFMAAGSDKRTEAEINSQEVYGPVYNPPADFSGNEFVEVNDLLKLAQHWLLQESSVDIAPPYSGDKIVNLQDFAVVSRHWLKEITHITQTVNNQSWLNPVWGTGPETPTFGINYVMAPGILRTSPAGSTNDGSAHFPGNSVTVVNASRFLIKQHGGQTASINGGFGNLIAEAGSRISFAGNWYPSGGGVITLDVGKLIVNGNTQIDMNDAGRNNLVAGTLTGTGDLVFQKEKENERCLMRFGDIDGYTGNITVKNLINLDFDVDYIFSGRLTLDSGGALVVDRTLTFDSGKLVASGITIPNGTYSGGSLTGLGSSFINGGGTLIVR